MLKAINISKSFKNKKIINNVNFSSEEGSITVFLGKSGVGKSTILRILNNLETIDSGSITFNNKTFILVMP